MISKERNAIGKCAAQSPRHLTVSKSTDAVVIDTDAATATVLATGAAFTFTPGDGRQSGPDWIKNPLLKANDRSKERPQDLGKHHDGPRIKAAAEAALGRPCT